MKLQMQDKANFTDTQWENQFFRVESLNCSRLLVAEEAICSSHTRNHRSVSNIVNKILAFSTRTRNRPQLPPYFHTGEWKAEGDSYLDHHKLSHSVRADRSVAQTDLGRTSFNTSWTKQDNRRRAGLPKLRQCYRHTFRLCRIFCWVPKKRHGCSVFDVFEVYIPMLQRFFYLVVLGSSAGYCSR